MKITLLANSPEELLTDTINLIKDDWYPAESPVSISGRYYAVRSRQYSIVMEKPFLGQLPMTIDEMFSRLPAQTV